MSDIWILMEEGDYEPDRLVAAFATESAAQATKLAIIAYVASAPKVDDEWETDRWWRADSRRRKHLAKCQDDRECSAAANYLIRKIPFFPATEARP